VVIDHVGGSLRGLRQTLDADKRIRFGRHPECEVAFDVHRDIDASSRHAELRPEPESSARWRLVDLGSSNGTYVDGRRVSDLEIAAGSARIVDFGTGGPRIRLFIGEREQIDRLPAARVATRLYAIAVAGTVALIAAVVILALRC